MAQLYQKQNVLISGNDHMMSHHCNSVKLNFAFSKQTQEQENRAFNIVFQIIVLVSCEKTIAKLNFVSDYISAN